MAYDTWPGIISADFSASPVEGPPALVVQFIDLGFEYELIDENDATDLIVETGDATEVLQEIGY